MAGRRQLGELGEIAAAQDSVRVVRVELHPLALGWGQCAGLVPDRVGNAGPAERVDERRPLQPDDLLRRQPDLGGG